MTITVNRLALIGVLLAIVSNSPKILAQYFSAPNYSFVQTPDQASGAPTIWTSSSSVLEKSTFYIGYRSSDGTNSLVIDSTNDGVTFNGAHEYTGATLGGDPAVFPNDDGFVFKSATSDAVETCTEVYDSYSLTCSLIPGTHMQGKPSIVDGNDGLVYIAYETSSNDPGGAGHLAIVESGGIPNNVIFEYPSIVMGGSPTMLNSPTNGAPDIGGLEKAYDLVFRAAGANSSLSMVGFNIHFAAGPVTTYGYGMSTDAGLAIVEGENEVQDPEDLTLMISFGALGTDQVSFTPFNEPLNALGPIEFNGDQTSSTPAMAQWIVYTGPYKDELVLTTVFKGAGTNYLYIGSGVAAYNN